MVTEKEGINHDTADTDWMVPNNKRLFYSTAFSGKPDLFHIHKVLDPKNPSY